jgi:hypothetical protein
VVIRHNFIIFHAPSLFIILNQETQVFLLVIATILYDPSIQSVSRPSAAALSWFGTNKHVRSIAFWKCRMTCRRIHVDIICTIKALVAGRGCLKMVPPVLGRESENVKKWKRSFGTDNIETKNIKSHLNALARTLFSGGSQNSDRKSHWDSLRFVYTEKPIVDDAWRRRPASSNLGRMLEGEGHFQHASHQRTASPWRLAVNNAIWIQ